MKQIAAILLSLLFPSSLSLAQESKVLQKSSHFFDPNRHRDIPVEIYLTKQSQDAMRSGTCQLPVAIISHGYTVKNSEYSFIAEALAKRGYYVVSIQHDLPTDPRFPEPTIKKRKPFWNRGAQDICFIMSTLKKNNPHLDLKKALLIGHSNGGDIALFFLLQHPEMVSKIVSLDSLRMPFPNNSVVPILTLRSDHDQLPNIGLLPQSGITIITLKNAKHIDLCDRGPKKVKQEVLSQIARFLKNHR